VSTDYTNIHPISLEAQFDIKQEWTITLPKDQAAFDAAVAETCRKLEHAWRSFTAHRSGATVEVALELRLKAH
jgi:hypothetical protein